MKPPFDHLRTGDISKTSPVGTKAEALARMMCMEAGRLQIPAAEALGAGCGFVTFILSHFAEPADRLAAMNAFFSAVQQGATGDLVVPLKKLLVDPKSPDATPWQNRPRAD